MGTMQLSEMREALRYDMDNRQDLSTTQLDRWLNWTYLHVTQPRTFRHPQLQATITQALVQDVVVYDITGVYYMDHVIYVNATTNSLTARRKKLLQGSIRHFEEGQYPQAEPTHYAMWGPDGGSANTRNLHLNHRPPSTIAGNIILVRGYQRPTTLSATTDTTVLDPAFDEILLLGARWRGWRSLNRPDHAELAKADFGQRITDEQEPDTQDATDWMGRFDPEQEPYSQTG